MLHESLPIKMLEGYTPKQFKNKQEFLNYVGNFVLEELDGIKSYETDDLIQIVSALEDVTDKELTYYVFEENLDSFSNIHHFSSKNEGDGNPLEEIYVILDEETKEYTLVGFSGEYSSWDSSTYDFINQIELKPVTAYETKDVF